MKTREVDIAIIGAGTAGMSAYRTAKDHTDNIVVIESGVYGTTCARVGCMPSKLLIAAAEVSHQIDNAAQFGIEVTGKSIDGAKVLARVKSERDRFVGFVEEAVENWPEEHKLIGVARFLSSNELQVGDHTKVVAKRIVIAAGTRPAIPGPWYALEDRLLINDDVFQWDTLPESIAVVGTGVIGMEISQALSRLGVRTHLFGVGDRFGPISDPAVNEQMKKVLEAELTLSSDATVDAVTKTATGVEVSYTEGGELKQDSFEFLLAATGRRSNLDALDLHLAGIKLDERGNPEFNDATGQIEDSHIFIAGDVSNAHPLLHEAADDGRIAGDNAGRYPDVKVRPRRAPLSVVFTDPQITLVGARYIELKNAEADFETGEASFEDQGRSRVIAKNKGLIRVYGERNTGLFLGAEMVGPAAEHIGHLLSWAVQHRFTVQQMLDSPFYHPVIEEGLRTALRGLNRNLQMGPVPVERCLDCGPGA
ncbi:MAG: dihydrolipoyl dehydrogenase [SAR86 cluster bacterium]|uniref:Dihydrolipoyl dehydrogenase n=1 Tax=SAR86 cluster bacterium TaxID=2030880 RepID=A0A2A4XG81_9GAMM|nr:MAG: dihydrolipoyl dehydrogenase [SAR86 cluster bacterium]